MPRNLGQISERLPAANYSSCESPEERHIDRHASLPSISRSQRETPQPIVPGSAIHNKARHGKLAVINEREEVVRSADPNMSKSRAMAAAAAVQQINVKNQPSGYNAAAPSVQKQQMSHLRRDSHHSN